MKIANIIYKSKAGHNEVLFYLLFFSSLMGMTGFWYIIMSFAILYKIFAKRHTKISYSGLFLSVIYIIIIVLKLFHFYDMSMWFPTIKFYMGWGVVICFLYLFEISVNVNKILIILNIEIIVEFILINTVLPANILPNYPNLDNIIMTGSMARVYSIGCNASITATIMVTLLSYQEIMKRHFSGIEHRYARFGQILSVISIVLLGSGVGFFIYLIFLFYKYKLLRIKYVIFGLTLIIAVFSLSKSISMDQDTIFQRISYEYIEFIYDYKEMQIMDMAKEYHVKNQLMGTDLRGSEDPLIWGDFAWLEYYVSLGYIGLMVFGAFVVKFINKYNFFPIILCVLGALHYGGIFTLPGQVAFAYALLLNKKSLGKYAIPNKSINENITSRSNWGNCRRYRHCAKYFG